MQQQSHTMSRTTQGFSMMEVLLMIGLLAAITSIIIFAINPAKQLADSRDLTRETDVFSLLQALYQYAADNEGEFPAAVTAIETEICASGAPVCTGLIDISILTANERYLISLPTDPLCSVDAQLCGNGTGYAAAVGVNGRITVNALHAENKVIQATQ